VDEISLVELAGGVVEVTINGQHYTVLGGLEQVVIDTLGDGRDQVHASGSLSFELLIDADGDGSTLADAKLEAAQQSFFNGTAMWDLGPGLGCGCPMCRAALDRALAGGVEEIAALADFNTRDRESSPEELSPAADDPLPLVHRATCFSDDSASADADELDRTASWGSDWPAHESRSLADIVFDLQGLEELVVAAVS
jgi:hypothetical protein